ncbi:MAG: 5-oxoprolinase (ATP-hydrolyzing) [Bryobacterales bacterium]|jgi:N-methylhydantoinase A|nr:5-oxoprolinase (ATP-hydrolyzing) [Bryobacterales bacterium]
MRIGVDAGGTFTDFVVLHDDGRLETFKLRSNPLSPAKVILAGLEQAARNKQKVDVVHGSTVATNALLERKGARTALVTTAGFEDLLEIGRQNRPELYNLTPTPRRPLIPRDLCFGVNERIYHDGTIARRPTAAELKRLTTRIKRSGVRSIAICFLHAYQNPANERAVLAALKQNEMYICASHEVSPEFREYERSSTTAVNAYVGPLMESYLGELESARRFQIAIMQSNGGFLSAREARRHAVRTVLSGPAGGVVGAMETGGRSGFRKILGFDMGGTSTDVSLADGAARETTEAYVDGFPIRVPMLDIHTVGAGGGSIARVDAGGLLRVGPESAGADPGPACYGSGTEPTVTDAHVVLGRIQSLLGGRMRVDADRAAAAIDRIARRLKLDRTAAAGGMLRVANSNMERAIRVVSVERGYDPREFALVAFGGCGGLHACDIATQLGIRSVIVPQYAGALSALGMLMADAVRDYAAGVLGHDNIENNFEALELRARRESPRAHIERSADLRYRGQSYELSVPWKAANQGFALFHREHARIYGYSLPKREVEVVTIRVRARAASPKPRLVRPPTQTGTAELRRVWIGSWRRVPVWNREQLTAAQRPGPALVLDYGSTTLVPGGWRFHVDRAGNLLIQQ